MTDETIRKVYALDAAIGYVEADKNRYFNDLGPYKEWKPLLDQLSNTLNQIKEKAEKDLKEL